MLHQKGYILQVDPKENSTSNSNMDEVGQLHAAFAVLASLYWISDDCKSPLAIFDCNPERVLRRKYFQGKMAFAENYK